MKKLHVLSLSMALAILLSSCLSDLRTKTFKKGERAQLEEKGRRLLDEAWKAQGMDKLREHKVYSMKAHDEWRGMLGKTGNPWPNAVLDVELKYNIGTFDSQVNYLSGKKVGEKAGLQSWNYYEQKPGEAVAFRKKAKPSISFILGAYQYFGEVLDRLRNAPLIAYAGEKTIDGEAYHAVLATWGRFKPHSRDDQYLLFIHKKTSRLDYMEYTLRNTYLPGSSMLYGTIAYHDFRDVDGISIPFRHTIYTNGYKKGKKYLHELVITEFSFDSFPQADLYPNPGIEKVGDDKVKGKITLQ